MKIIKFDCVLNMADLPLYDSSFDDAENIVETKCVFCKVPTDNIIEYGEKYVFGDLVVHNFCLVSIIIITYFCFCKVLLIFFTFFHSFSHQILDRS